MSMRPTNERIGVSLPTAGEGSKSSIHATAPVTSGQYAKEVAASEAQQLAVGGHF